tara:strand:- start:156 stop:1349 length:1194 start_codon:yes stop_codon:yes gene_type:complete
VEADNVRSSYNPFDTLDFSLNFENRALIAGSVRIEGNYRILESDGTTPLSGEDDKVCVDNRIGSHAFFHSMQTVLQGNNGAGIGNVENIVEYPRMVSTIDNGRLSDNDLLSASMVCENRSPDIKIQRALAQDKCPADKGGGATGTGKTQHLGSGYDASTNLTKLERVHPDFSIKPKIAINNVISQNALLNYSTSGQVRISLNLERDLIVLQNNTPESASKNYTYRLYNVRVTFASVPQIPKQLPIQMRSHLCLKSTINSNMANVSSKVPAIVDSVFISFLPQARESSRLFKNTELEKIPSLNKVLYSFNDSTNKYVSFELKKLKEIMYYGIKAVNKSNPSKNATSMAKLDASKSFMMGLDLGQPIDLSNQKFNVQIESEASNVPFLMFSYYSSILSL